MSKIASAILLIQKAPEEDYNNEQGNVEVASVKVME